MKLARKLTDTEANGLQWQPTIIDKNTGQPKPNKAGFTIYWCGKTQGFGVRVTDSGAKTWVAEQRVAGKTVRRGLGRVGKISAEQARKDAKKTIGELSHGKDLYAEKRAAAEKAKVDGIMFADALRQYVNDNSARSLPLAERTKKDYLLMLWAGGMNGGNRERKPGELADIADTPINKITGPALKSLYEALQKRGRTRAAYAMRVVRATLRYHGIKLDENPFDKDTAGKIRIRLPAANARDRVIKLEELRAWWKAADATEDGGKFMFMLLAGVRPGETEAIKVSDIDLAGGRISIADPSKPYVVLLSRQAKAIVADAMKGKAPADALFERDARKSLAFIVKESGVQFSPHDLRRTFSSIAANIVSEAVRKAMLNHSDGSDVTFTHYTVLDEKVLRQGWQAVADFVMKQVSRPVRRVAA
jgi:integrase